MLRPQPVAAALEHLLRELPPLFAALREDRPHLLPLRRRQVERALERPQPTRVAQPALLVGAADVVPAEPRVGAAAARRRAQREHREEHRDPLEARAHHSSSTASKLAANTLQTALAAIETRLDPDDPDLAQTRTELAHALLAADRAHNTATARDLLAQAQAAFTALGPAYAPEAQATHP